MSIFSGYSNLKDYYKKSPISSILIFVLLFITIAQVFAGHYSEQSLINFGALRADLVADGDYYRLFTVMFLHGSIDHFFSNAFFGLFILGGTLERLIKTWRYLVIYFIGGLGASLTIILTSTELTVGASGAIFSALGALLYLTIYRSDLIKKPERMSIWALIVIEIIFTLTAANISIAGHLGGLASGFLLSYIVISRKQIEAGIIVESHPFEQTIQNIPDFDIEDYLDDEKEDETKYIQ